MRAVMRMVRKVKTQHVLVALVLVAMLFGCRCALKKLGVEGFEEVTGFEGDRMVLNLASWCGHCKAFKASGEIDKLKEDPDVPVEVNEDDEEANKKYGVKGFPSILKVKEDGEQIPFKGPRTAESMKEFFNNN